MSRGAGLLDRACLPEMQRARIPQGLHGALLAAITALLATVAGHRSYSASPVYSC